MAFADTWDASFEATPADVEARSLGANRMRQLRKAVRERLEIDHSLAGDADDGKHKQVTFVTPLGSDPTTIALHGYLYTKNIAALVELFWKNENGNVIQLTDKGKINAEKFSSGTKMLFQQTAAPTGWTKDTTHNDKALRVVTGTVSSGGANAYSTVFGSGKATASHTLTVDEIPAHNHTYDTRISTTVQFAGALSGWKDDTSINTGNTGGSSGHAHNLTLDLQFVDLIIATKD